MLERRFLEMRSNSPKTGEPLSGMSSLFSTTLVEVWLWDSLYAECLVYGEPVLMAAGDGLKRWKLP